MDGRTISRRIMRRAARHEKAIRMGAAVVVTLTSVVAGVLLALASDVKSDDKLNFLKASLYVLAVALGLIQLVANVGGTLLTNGDAEAAIAILDQEDEITTAEQIIGDQYTLLTALTNSLAALQAVFRMPPPQDNASLRTALGQILGPFWATKEIRSSLFAFEKGDLYSMTVYFSNPKMSRLESCYRHGSKKITERGLGRPWEYGKGHVGQCFESAQIMVAADMKLAFHVEDGDKSLYASAASVPIFVDNEVVGVCIVTSSRTQQFGQLDEKTGEFDWEAIRPVLEILGNVLSVYFTYTRNRTSVETTNAEPNRHVQN